MTLRILTVVSLLCLPAWGQVDTEARNDTRAGADRLPLSAGHSLNNVGELAFPAHDVDFYRVELDQGDVLLGMLTPLGNVDPRDPFTSDFSTPDTNLGSFRGAQGLTLSDDDQAAQPRRGSKVGSLLRLHADVTDTYHLGLSGGADEEFQGYANLDHGRYLLTLGRLAPQADSGEFAVGGGLRDSAGNDRLAGADSLALAGSVVGVGELDGRGGDIDFFRLELQQGQVLNAMTAPLEDLAGGFDTPDTILGLFDADGTLLLSNDDAGDRLSSRSSDSPAGGLFGSALRTLIRYDGTYYLGVTGYGDEQFTGAHGQLGRYGLLVGAVPEVLNPEPSGLTLLACGGLLLCSLRRRSRPGGGA
jgi:hypothetical protein